MPIIPVSVHDAEFMEALVCTHRSCMHLCCPPPEHDARCAVAAATLSERYLSERKLPDKAIDLIDEAASRLRLQQESKPEPIQDLDRELIRCVYLSLGHVFASVFSCLAYTCQGAESLYHEFPSGMLFVFGATQDWTACTRAFTRNAQAENREDGVDEGDRRAITQAAAGGGCRDRAAREGPRQADRAMARRKREVRACVSSQSV